MIRTDFKIVKKDPPLQSLVSKGYRGGIDNAPFLVYTISINNKEREEIMKKIEEMQELVNDLFWEYQRMSSSGKKTLDKIAVLVGVPTDAEMEKTSKETI